MVYMHMESPFFVKNARRNRGVATEHGFMKLKRDGNIYQERTM